MTHIVTQIRRLFCCYGRCESHEADETRPLLGADAVQPPPPSPETNRRVEPEVDAITTPPKQSAPLLPEKTPTRFSFRLSNCPPNPGHGFVSHRDAITAALPALTAVRRIGSGAYGSVFEAVATDGRPVAVKVQARYRSSEAELNTLRRLQPVPGVIQLVEHHVVDRPDRLRLLVFERLDLDLESLLLVAVCGRLPVAEVRRLGHRIATVVDAIHRAGVVHHDLKLANIMLVRRGRTGGHQVTKSTDDDDLVYLDECDVRVIDFGLAEERPFPEVSSTPSQATLAQPLWYLDPWLEDAFALGLVLATLLFGPAKMAEARQRGIAMARRIEFMTTHGSTEWLDDCEARTVLDTVRGLLDDRQESRWSVAKAAEQLGGEQS